ncbi:putative ATP/GTP-binding protein [Ktedonobacter racemifer DSM 44963]|uniref:Putative ATP/GTP-binding protein n=1 Tax=Ktedonobacter racemifer DSM 44963 TaxID=485913 RepID=D6U2L3_KTERA|nr:putative ATP/GTP-binding protein [Ktedonobacter racemifer DSM 44963]
MNMAADILRVLAVMQTVDIPEFFFLAGARHLGAELEALITEPYLLDLAVGVLRRLSLVQRHTEKQMLAFHPLLQRVLSEHMSDRERAMWKSRVTAASAAIKSPL